MPACEHADKNQQLMAQPICNKWVGMITFKQILTMKFKRFCFLLLLMFCFIGMWAHGTSDTSHHKGLLFGLAFGGGNIHLKSQSTSKSEPVLSLPNIKFGYWLNTRTSVHFLMPGAVYNLKGTDRIFEAFQLGVSRWISPRWCVLGATGLTFDAGAFYTVDKLSQIKANTGLPSFSVGTGYEVWSKKKYGIDFQYRFFYGRSNLDNGDHRIGMAHVFLLGFNLY